MAHRRHRRYNTRTQFPEQNLDNDLCWMVHAGNRLFLRGQTGRALHGDGIVGVNDAAAQADNAMRNVLALLAEAGAGLQDIVKIKLWVTDRAYLAPVVSAVGRHLRGVHPADSIVIVKGLARPEYFMEIDVEVILSAAEAGR